MPSAFSWEPLSPSFLVALKVHQNRHCQQKRPSKKSKNKKTKKTNLALSLKNQKSNMQFFKLQATGNDFVFVIKPPNLLTATDIRKMCDRHFGVGSDGLVILQPTASPQEYRWTFYNPDGSEAEMCGNAARAATALVYHLYQQKEVRVQTKVGFFRGRVETAQMTTIEMELPPVSIRKIASLFSGKFAEGYLTNTGVPHCVIPVADLEKIKKQAQELAPFIFDSEFGTQGANLTFYSVSAENSLQVVTLERGVNDFTLSCGTGVIAAAQVYSQLEKKNSQISVQTPGGSLWVDFASLQNAKLKGEAQFVFEGSWK